MEGNDKGLFEKNDRKGNVDVKMFLRFFFLKVYI